MPISPQHRLLNLWYEQPSNVAPPASIYTKWGCGLPFLIAGLVKLEFCHHGYSNWVLMAISKGHLFLKKNRNVFSWRKTNFLPLLNGLIYFSNKLKIASLCISYLQTTLSAVTSSTDQPLQKNLKKFWKHPGIGDIVGVLVSTVV